MVVPCFGDTGASWLRVARARDAQRFRWTLPDLPGFGASPRLMRTSISALADVLAAHLEREPAPVALVGHSVGSVIAVEAAGRAGDRVAALVSVEGNLTPDDAYFSGTAADYDTPAAFHEAFLDRLWDMARDDRASRAYLGAIAQADAVALWELGRDARRLADPGRAYRELACPTLYWWAPASITPAGRRYLTDHELPSLRVEDGTHTPFADRPHLLASELVEALGPHLR